jgi:hypothetical protein
VRTADQAPGERDIDARAAQRPIRVTGDRASELRCALGTGSLGSHFPRHACYAATETNHHISQRRRNAGCIWNAARRIAIPAADRRLPAGFGATIFFGTDTQAAKAAVAHQARFNFMREARIWYSRDPNQELLPGGFENVIVLSDEFYREVTAHSIPTDLEAARALSSAPAALDLYMWLSYRCFTAKGQERIPIFGEFGLVAQLGSVEYARPRKFRERLDRWLDLIRCLWPGCPARISGDGEYMLLQPALALAGRGA